MYDKVRKLILTEKIEELEKMKKSGVDFLKVVDKKSINLGLPEVSLAQFAISAGNVDILKIILSESKLDSTKWTSCSINNAFDAIEEEETKRMISYLVSLGEDINCNKAISDHGGPLSKAIDSGSVELVNFLLENGANVDQNYGAMGSPLIIAIKEKKNKIALALIRNAKDLSIVDDDGKTALDIAKDMKMNKIVKSLEAKN